jgi:hypothetical protein
MRFFQEFEKVVQTLAPSPKLRVQELEHQVVICEHCFQAYAYLKRGRGLKLTLLTAGWLTKQPREVRSGIVAAVESLRQSWMTIRLVKRWRKRMTR